MASGQEEAAMTPLHESLLRPTQQVQDSGLSMLTSKEPLTTSTIPTYFKKSTPFPAKNLLNNGLKPDTWKAISFMKLRQVRRKEEAVHRYWLILPYTDYNKN
jgi:hypothetical protein